MCTSPGRLLQTIVHWLATPSGIVPIRYVRTNDCLDSHHFPTQVAVAAVVVGRHDLCVHFMKPQHVSRQDLKSRQKIDIRPACLGVCIRLRKDGDPEPRCKICVECRALLELVATLSISEYHARRRFQHSWQRSGLLFWESVLFYCIVGALEVLGWDCLLVAFRPELHRLGCILAGACCLLGGPEAAGQIGVDESKIFNAQFRWTRIRYRVGRSLESCCGRPSCASAES